jgi:hypothetical protein
MAAPEPPSTCAVCLAEPAVMALVPCGHKCVCPGCCTRLRADSAKCPICRARIDAAIHVHDAGVPQETPPLPPHHAPLAHAVSITVAPDPASAGRGPISVSVVMPPVADGTVPGAVVRISPPEDITVRLGADIVVAIDVSGSMGEDATYEDAAGAVRTDGLSVLDIARHGIRVVAALLKVSCRRLRSSARGPPSFRRVRAGHEHG